MRDVWSVWARCWRWRCITVFGPEPPEPDDLGAKPWEPAAETSPVTILGQT